MSRLESLLQQEEPLEKHEIADLKDWLSALEEDCKNFGATGVDRFRMDVIRMKIESQS